MSWFAPACKYFDDQHAAAAARAWARQDGRLIRGGRFWLGLNSWRGHAEQRVRFGDVIGAIAVGQHSVMADAMEALRQHVTEEAADELCRGQRHRLEAAFAFDLALKLVSECGDDLSAWPSAKHFTSWLCLAPSNKISGGKILSSKTRRSGSRAAALLRLAAVTIGRTDTALGAFYRRLSARIGKSKAVTATARKIAVLFYNALRHGMDYVDPGASYYEARYRERVVDNLHRRAKAFGYVLQPAAGAEVGSVS